MIDHDDTGIAVHGRRAAPEELSQIDDRQKLPTNVGDSLDPRLGSGDAGHAGGNSQHLTGFLASDEVQIPCHAQRYANPFTSGGAFLTHLRGHGAAAPCPRK